MQITINKLPKSEIEILGTMEADVFEKFRAQAIKHLNEHSDLPGFRQGHIPENVLTAAVGEMGVLEEMAEIAIASKYTDILVEHKIDAIGRPKVSILKIAKGNPLEFKIVTAVVPEITLPDYKTIAEKIAEKKEKTSVTDEEVEKVILEIRRQRAHVHVEGEDPKAHEIKEEDLPPMDEEFFKSLGAFKDAEELRAKIKENLGHEKEQKAREKTRMEIVKGILEKTEMELPEILAKSELHRMIEQQKFDIANMGLKFEDYLNIIKKTEDDLRKDLAKDAEDRAKTQLIIDKIAEVEKISPDAELVSHEVEHILEHHKDADPNNAKHYVEMVMTNDKVLEFLENRK